MPSNNIKWILKEQDWRAWTGFIWLRIGTALTTFEYTYGNKPAGSAKCGEIID
jgi:hypothetical protein